MPRPLPDKKKTWSVEHLSTVVHAILFNAVPAVVAFRPFVRASRCVVPLTMSIDEPFSLKRIGVFHIHDTLPSDGLESGVASHRPG